MKKLEVRGGATIGWAGISIPFARLKVNQSKLELKASILGNLIFQPGDVISIEPYSQFLGNGIRINHKVSPYKEKVIFWTQNNPESVIQQIQQTGFLDRDNSASTNPSIIERQKQSGFPFKISFMVTAVVIWNILLLHDFVGFFQSGMKSTPLGYGALLALGLVFLTTLATLFSSSFRRLVLKKGRDIGDIKLFAYFILFLSGCMMLGIGLAIRFFPG